MKIEIEQGKLDELERAAEMLNALQANGVDNWVGYEDAVSEFQKQDKLNKGLEDMLLEIEGIILKDAHEPSERGAGYSTSDISHYNALKILKHHISLLNR